jgi:magnesium chelatase family protein
LGDPQKECVCTPLQIQRYRSKVSGPLLDRIDIQVEVPALRYQELASKDAGELSAVIRQRVNAARAIQLQRRWVGTEALRETVQKKNTFSADFLT